MTNLVITGPKIMLALALYGAIWPSTSAVAHTDEKEVREWPEVQSFLCNYTHTCDESEKWYEVYKLKDSHIDTPGLGIDDSIEDVRAFPQIRIRF
jgi:hypothetical protein